MIRVGKEEAAPERLLPWLEAHLGPPLNAAQIEALRYAFTPEVVVPAQLTVRKPLERSVAAQLTSYLLSYDQERILKHDLDLSAEAEATTDNMHLQLVNGIAGSGKSLILLYRARLLRQFFPRKRILVLTHNRPLIRDLERRYLLLTNDDRRVKWFTFHGWCCYYWFKQDPKYKIIKTFERQKLIQQAWQKHLVDTAISPKMIESEIDWLKDRLITTREAYIEADRAGRGFALKEAMRSRVYDAIHTYQALLQEKNQLDFGDVPRRIWRLLHENAAAIPSYDVILIDEAQFFAPIWFSIIKQILRPPHGHLFMVADPTQGFLKRRQSWLASGLNVRGQSQRLEQCYRTTREILSFASRFYQQRLPDDDEAIVGVKLQQTPSGLMPEVIALRSEQDETARVINEIRALVAAKVPLDQILIIHANWQGADRLLTRLKTLLGAEQVVHPRDGTGTNQLRVCQLDAVTGLESPIVFLVGCHRILEAEDNPRLSAEERAEQLRDNTRRLYMAMTRAGQRLVVTYVGAVPPCMT
ncbi:MAG: hypothetical protein EI684_17815 [Candidatus Viridilinea halotolerans]|uniref:UvrD-like helicase ATP-binding domain-containing protein n=1 Tax=Candidatus Viridilinea halotolerans TaxID=2491704 RepID=A0A426TTZ2_9CHLR|nr:MAG: hypothetical protein EI684_17815 [Candidatus Viridilinea halotolerans]